MAHCSLLWSEIASQAALSWNRALENTQAWALRRYPVVCRWTLCKDTEDVIPDSSVWVFSISPPFQPFPATAWRLLMSSVKLKGNPKTTWLSIWPSVTYYIHPHGQIASHIYPAPPLVSNGLLQDLSVSQVLQVTTEYRPRLDGEGSP